MEQTYKSGPWGSVAGTATGVFGSEAWGFGGIFPSVTGTGAMPEHLSGIPGAEAEEADLLGRELAGGAAWAPDELSPAPVPEGVAGWTMMTGPDLRDAVALASYGDLLFVGRRMGGLSVMKWEGDGSVRNLRNAAVSLGHFVVLEIVEEFEEDFLIGASVTENMVLSWQISPSGHLTEIGRIGIGEILGVASPGAMTVTVIDGVPYVLVADAEGTSAGALALTQDGALSVAETFPALAEVDMGGTGWAPTADEGDMLSGAVQMPEHGHEIGQPDLQSLDMAAQSPSGTAGGETAAHGSTAAFFLFGDEGADSFDFRTTGDDALLPGRGGDRPETGVAAQAIWEGSEDWAAADLPGSLTPAGAEDHAGELWAAESAASPEPDLLATALPQLSDLPF